jgi:hypothetical protein
VSQDSALSDEQRTIRIDDLAEFISAAARYGYTLATAEEDAAILMLLPD